METKDGLFLEVDTDIDEFEWEMIAEDIATLFEEKNPEGYFFCKVENFGWRKMDGFLFAELHTGQDLVTKVLPNTACTFKIFLEKDNTIKIQNFHHDSPTGDEWYTLTPITQEQFDNKEVPE